VAHTTALAGNNMVITKLKEPGTGNIPRLLVMRADKRA